MNPTTIDAAAGAPAERSARAENDAGAPADQPRLATRLSRMRFAVPLIVAGATVGLFVNEFIYKRTVEAMHAGSSLTAARIAAAGVLQLLTDAETGQRGYLLTNRTEYLIPLEAAKIGVPAMRATVSDFLRGSGPGGHDVQRRMARDIDETLAEIDRTVNLMRAGDPKAALQIIDAGGGRRRMDDMRSIFNTSLLEAAERQRVSGMSIDRSIWTNRIAVMMLTLLGATALCLYVRHLRLYDVEREHRQRELEEQVRHRTAELRQLASYLQSAREDEKAHLARELHDELGGLLTAAKLNMARMRRAVTTDAVMLERIGQVSACLDEGIALKRRIVEELRPSSLEVLGLNVVLSNLCADTAVRMGIPIRTEFDEVSLSGDEELALYRLVQEALTNIGKYANATLVRVHMKLEPGCVRVGIEDNGIGFDVTQLKSSTHGIAGMRFRIERLDGRFTVDSTPAVGTRLVAMLPIR